MGLYVVIDEAYYEFAGHTVADFVNEYETLMVVQDLQQVGGPRRGAYRLCHRLRRRCMRLPQPD